MDDEVTEKTVESNVEPMSNAGVVNNIVTTAVEEVEGNMSGETDCELGQSSDISQFSPLASSTFNLKSQVSSLDVEDSYSNPGSSVEDESAKETNHSDNICRLNV